MRSKAHVLILPFITNDECKRKVVYPAGGGTSIAVVSNPNQMDLLSDTIIQYDVAAVRVSTF